MRAEKNYAAETDRHPGTILLVDDSPVNLGVIAESLEVDGYDVLVALDGDEALQRVEIARPDLILLDVMMPGMDGYEVCRRLKSQEHTRDIPVIFMTSLGCLEDRVKGFEAGAVDYVTKPLQVEETRARVCTHLKLRVLQQRLEAKNTKLQAELAERKHAEQRLKQALEFSESIINAIPDLLFELDRGGKYHNVWAQNPELLAAQKEVLLGNTVHDVLAPEAAAIVMDSIRDADEKGFSFGKIICIAVAHGESWFELSVSRKTASDALTNTFLVLSRDITERKRTEDALIERERELRTLLDNTPDIIARYDRDCRRRYANPAFGAMVGGGVTGLIGSKPSECPGGAYAESYEGKLHDVFATGANVEFEVNWTSKDGVSICTHTKLAAERNSSGEVISVLAVGRDITELNAYREKIHRMAFYDSLTSLPNRALFNDRLRQMLIDASWHGQHAGVMLLDLDRFKMVNDTLGHPAGDELLREAASRLMHGVRDYDTVARLGGDEFAILLPEVRFGEDIGGIALKILKSFNEPFSLEGRDVFVSCSIGIVVYPEDGSDADDLLRQADSAMYLAKRSGRNNFRFYSKELTDSANERLSLESELRHAIARNELELYYQPKVNLADGTVMGSEALLRWNRPERGTESPDTFVWIAEDCGLIVEIGEWVLRDACRTAYERNSPGKPLHKVAINLSARQFQSGDLVNTVRAILNETCCAPGWIELEITESLLLDEGGEVLETLEAFRAMGITIAIDDFGTGYSSLSYLARFPISTLKIDRSFIRNIASDSFQAELVKAIISIAHCLGQQIVAEGVETSEQAVFLAAHGCHIAQGYLYSKPLPKHLFEALPLAYSSEQ
ncbi:MAG TPA: EAL domain-containing protein [Gallionella sp.]|nr:EAL domain-containing protein [Gallionella sp.]